MPSPPHSPALERAYRSAEYRVAAPTGPITLRIGAKSPLLDALIESLGLPPDRRRWAHVTACNPRSTPLSEAENEHRMGLLHAALVEACRALGSEGPGAPALLRGEGRSPSGDWTEPAFWVVGLEPAVVEALGRRFEQNALVEGDPGAPARLRWLDGPAGGEPQRAGADAEPGGRCAAVPVSGARGR